MNFDSDVWGPHYWFFLHTIAHSYPENPNAVTKRKYYDLIQNFPLFMPDREMGDHFAQLLDQFPVSPYLHNRASFMKWVHFIHNRINVRKSRPVQGYTAGLDAYEALYRPPPLVAMDDRRTKKQLLVVVLVLCMTTAACLGSGSG